MARYKCTGCGFVYDEATGDEYNGYPAGTRWQDLPDDYTCSDCCVREKVDFTQKEPEPHKN